MQAVDTITKEKEDAEEMAAEFKKLEPEQQVAVSNIMIGMQIQKSIQKKEVE